MTKVITKENTVEMAGYRQESLQHDYPQLKLEDYADEAAYRQALIEQYQALRQQEFSYVVRNEAMKAYNVSSEANVRKGYCNSTSGAWGGYRTHPEASDSCFVHVPDMVKRGGLPSSGESCAISANALTLTISDKMGYPEDANLIVVKDRNDYGCARNNLASAGILYRQDSAEDYSVKCDGKTQKPTLNEAIKRGIVGAGDEISIVTGNARGTTTSGCHAMVVVDVLRDESGKVTNYTLQGNNPPTLVTVDANNPDYYGTRPLNCAIRTSEWISSKISAEIPEGMSIEEIEGMVSATRQRVSTTIGELQGTEQHYAEHKHYNDEAKVNNAKAYGFGDGYNRDLDKARSVSQDRNRVSELEESIQLSMDQLRKELREQKGELRDEKQDEDKRVVSFNCAVDSRSQAFSNDAMEQASQSPKINIYDLLRNSGGRS